MGGCISCCLNLLLTKMRGCLSCLFRPLMEDVVALQGKSGYSRMLLVLPLCEFPPSPQNNSPLSAGLSICVGFTNVSCLQMPATSKNQKHDMK